MSDIFPRTRKTKTGYNTDEVEKFFTKARTAYDTDPHSPSGLTPSKIRTVAFSMQRGGYSAAHVDAALERLEDAFATRERERAISENGAEQWYDTARQQAQVIMNRLGRPPGRRFTRASALSAGYNRSDVDRFTNRIRRYFEDGEPLVPNDVRTVVFRSERGGYKEIQVDLVLDAVVEVMLAVR